MTEREIEIPDEIAERLTRLATVRGQTESEIVNEALREYIREYGSGAGNIIVGDDFDEPLEDFDEYR